VDLADSTHVITPTRIEEVSAITAARHEAVARARSDTVSPYADGPKPTVLLEPDSGSSSFSIPDVLSSCFQMASLFSNVTGTMCLSPTDAELMLARVVS
jgi:hypothetical protein